MSDNTPTEEQKKRIERAVNLTLKTFSGLDPYEFLLYAESLLGLAVISMDSPVWAYSHACDSLRQITDNECGGAVNGA